jgi:hypothetical protein
VATSIWMVLIAATNAVETGGEADEDVTMSIHVGSARAWWWAGKPGEELASDALLHREDMGGGGAPERAPRPAMKEPLSLVSLLLREEMKLPAAGRRSVAVSMKTAPALVVASRPTSMRPAGVVAVMCTPTFTLTTNQICLV